MPVVVVSAAVLDYQQRILCVKQNYGAGYWALPGGGLESGESPTEGLAREIREETGFDAHIDHLIGVYSAPWKDSLVLLFRAHILDRGQWEPNEEITEIGFFVCDDLPQPMNSRMRVRIQDAVDGRQGVVRTFPLTEE